MIHNIHSLVIDSEKIHSAQEKFRPLLDQIDAMRDPNQDGKALVTRWIDVRMGRYAGRIADEFKARKDKDREAAFRSVVDDVRAHTLPLLEKDEITWQDLSTLHTRLYPKGLWGQSKNDRGEKMLVKFPTGVWRQHEDFVRTSRGDIYFLPHEHIPDALDQIERFFRESTDIHFLIRLMLLLAFTSYVHPYYNGNGTVLYFYMGLLLVREGYPIPFAVDRYFTSQSIGDHLLACRDGSDYDTVCENFLRSFLEG